MIELLDFESDDEETNDQAMPLNWAKYGFIKLLHNANVRQGVPVSPAYVTFCYQWPSQAPVQIGQ